MRKNNFYIQQNFFRDNRLVFADKKLESSDTHASRLQEMEAAADDPTKPDWLRKNAKKVASKIRNGSISTELGNEILDHYNKADYAENKHFQKFFETLTNLQTGKLKEKGEGMFTFVQVAMGKVKANDFQKQHARKVIKKYHEAGENFELRESELEDDLALLADLGKGRKAKDLTESVESLAVTTTNQAETNARTREIIPQNESAGVMLDEKFPIEKSRELSYLGQKEGKIVNQVLPLIKQADSLEKEIETLKSDDAEKNQGKIARLSTALKTTQAKIQKLEDQKQEINERQAELGLEYTQYQKRMLARRRAKRQFKERLGLDLDRSRELIVGDDIIEIVDIDFDPHNLNGDDEMAESNPRTEAIEKEAPGRPFIVFKRNGELAEKPYPNQLTFIRQILAQNGAPKIKNVDELNQALKFHNGQEDLAAGQEFIHETKNPFKVTDVDRSGYVYLDRPVNVRPASQLSESVQADKRVDIEKSKLTFGEFTRFIISNGYHRDLQPDQIQHAIDGNREDLAAKCAGFTDGMNDDQKEIFKAIRGMPPEAFQAPKAGERLPVYIIQNRHCVQGELSLGPDGSYHFQRRPFYPHNPQILTEAGVPQRFVSKDAVSTFYSKLGDEGKPVPITKLSSWDLVNLAKNVDIYRVPEELMAQHRLKEAQDLEAAQAEAKNHFATSGKQAATTQASGDGKVLEFPNRNNYSPDEGDFSLDQSAHANLALQAGEKEIDPKDIDPFSDMQTKEDINADLYKEGPPVDQEDVKALESPFKKAKFKEEALPYNDIHKVGGMNFEDEGYLKALWDSTRFFSVSDFWAMGKTMWEYYDRRWQRRQKEKYSSVGQHLPYFSPEMKRINQSAENEEVNQFKETFEQFGVLQIQERLRITSNKDEMKAAFIVLTDKGQMRWDDVTMWKNLNQWLGKDLKIPIPIDGDPFRIITEDENDPNYKRTGMDFMKPALDALWGEGTYDDWYSKNKNSYSSNAKNVEEEGKELEGVEGGHETRLSELLNHHLSGGFVDPHRYEGLILQAIDYGKTSMQAKIYYMIEGVSRKNSQGRTILPFDRIAHINSTYLARFPILEYICAGVPRPPDGKTHRWTLKDYQRWSGIFNEGDPGRTKPGVGVDKFLWKYVITSDENKRRMNKALRNAEGIDHDDFFAYLPPASYGVVRDVCRSQTGGGGKKFLTIEGYKNVYPGFSQMFRSLAEKKDVDKMRDAIASWVTFDTIMSERYENGNKTGFQRLDGPDMNAPCVASPATPRAHAAQLNQMVNGVIEAYSAQGAKGADKLKEAWDLSQLKLTPEELIADGGKKRQQRIDAAINAFPDLLAKVLVSDSGAAMYNIVRAASENNQLMGMPFGLSQVERDRRMATITKNEYNLAS